MDEKLLKKQPSEARVRALAKYAETHREINILKARERHKNKKDADNAKCRQYNIDHKEEIAAKAKERRLRNIDEIKQTKKLYYQINRQAIRARATEARKREDIRATRNLRESERKRTEPVYKITHNIRTLIGNSFKHAGFKKNSKTTQILGCSFIEFKLHLEAQFEPWMTWNNHGKYTGELNVSWDIDHILPLSSAVTEEDLVRLNHYTNLQPLCSYVNRNIKRDRIAA